MDEHDATAANASPDNGAQTTPLPPKRTDWHVLLGGVQQPLLTPVDITVETEPLATQKPPRIDILLLRRKGSFWTPEQQARLPDGIRQSHASHILCEFKYTESVNESALLQARLYDHLYLTSRRLKRRTVQTFMLSSHTPQRDMLAYFEYQPTALRGVYHSQDKWLKVIDLLVLNELSDEPHNAFFKCFASRKKAREAAFATIEQMAIWTWSEELWATVSGLHTVFQRLEGGAMSDYNLTPEYLRKLGEGMRDQIMATLSPEERLAGLPPEVILSHFSPEQLLAGLAPEVIEAYLQKRKQRETAEPATPRRKSKKTKALAT